LRQQCGREDRTKITGAAGDEDFHIVCGRSLPFPMAERKKTAQLPVP
jgi:hypothetical protein